MSFLISLKFSTLTNYIAASSWIILDPRDYTRVWKLLATVSNFWNFFPPSVDLYLEIQNVSSTAGNDEPGIGEREEPIIPKSPQKMSDRDCLPWLTRNPLLIMMEGPIKQTCYNLPIEFIPLLETFKCRIELEYTEY